MLAQHASQGGGPKLILRLFNYAHVGSGPRKRLCTCAVQVEPAAWPGPAFRRRSAPAAGDAVTASWSAGRACCSPRTLMFCHIVWEGHSNVHQVCSCRPELRHCHCRHCCCQHCRPPSNLVGVGEAIAGYCRGCALPQGIWVASTTTWCSGAHEKKESAAMPSKGTRVAVRPHVADMPEVDFQQGALSGPRACSDLRHLLCVCFLHALVRSQP
jgi:hypothetical protein